MRPKKVTQSGDGGRLTVVLWGGNTGGFNRVEM